MALIKCTKCGHQISSVAKSCPKCRCATGNESGKDKYKSDSLQSKCKTRIDSASANPPYVNPPPVNNKSNTHSHLENQKTEDDWYFVTPHGRNGPVNFLFLQQLVAAGQINNDTRVWRAGLPDWVKFTHYKESSEEVTPQEPPRIPEKPVNSAYTWALALAPAWGAVIQIIATETRIAITHKNLDYYAQMWWIVIACNIIASYIDLSYWNKSIHASDKIDGWLCLLVPVYIFRRDRIENAGLKMFWIWNGSLIFSVAALMAMNSIYSLILSK